MCVCCTHFQKLLERAEHTTEEVFISHVLKAFESSESKIKVVVFFCSLSPIIQNYYFFLFHFESLVIPDIFLFSLKSPIADFPLFFDDFWLDLLFIVKSKQNRKLSGNFSYLDLSRLFLVILHHSQARGERLSKKSRKVEVRKIPWKFPSLFWFHKK